MAVTYDSISTTTLNSSSGTVSITSIPQTYTDLVVVGRMKATSAGGVFIKPNGGVNYCTFRNMTSDGSTYSSSYIPTANQFTGVYHEIAGSSTGVFTTVIYHFNNYSTTNQNKTILYTSINELQSKLYVGLAPTTSAISSITWFNENGAFATGSTWSLYGILAA